MYYDHKRPWLSIIHKLKPKTIIEIGTAKAMTAFGMISCALEHHDVIHYDGYDLFDLATEETDKQELNKKGTGTYNKPYQRLKRIQRRNPGFTFELHRGFTTNSLIRPVVSDLVYIDGGHSYETVKHDYSMVSGCKNVIFDDYHLESVKRFIDELGKNYNLIHIKPNKILLNKF